MSPKSVLVAMSGGVDSSVAACLQRERGYRVLGSHLKLIHLDGVDHEGSAPGTHGESPRV